MNEHLQHTRVGDVMTQGLVTVGPQASLGFAHQLMMWSNVRHLPVMDGSKLVGLVADRTLLASLVEDAERAVADVMATEPPTLDPNDDLGEASARMATGRHDAMLVVSEGQLVGILTTTDVLAERGRLFFKDHHLDVPDVSAVMSTDVHVLHPDHVLGDALALMVDQGLRHVPIVDGDDRVVGLLSDRDLRAAVGDPLVALAEDAASLHEVHLEEIMNRAPMVIAADASLVDLARCFLDDRVGALPVIDDDEQVVGIVSYVDLIRHAVAVRRA